MVFKNDGARALVRYLPIQEKRPLANTARNRFYGDEHLKKFKSKMAVLNKNKSGLNSTRNTPRPRFFPPFLDLLVAGEYVEAAPIQTRLHLRTQSEDGQQLGCHLAALE